jgi:transcriptional regulator with XRE-family HTH domain
MSKKFLDGPVVEAQVEAVVQGLPGWGAALRALRRKENNLTASRLAQLVGCGCSTIYGYEQEKMRPRAGTLRNVLIALNVNPKLIGRLLPAEEPPANSLEVLSVLSVNSHPRIAVTEILAALPTGSNEDIESALYEKLVLPTIAAQAVRALSGDTKAAAFLLSRADTIRRAKRQRTPQANAGNFERFPVGPVPTTPEKPLQGHDED